MNLATAISRSKKLIIIILILANSSVFAQLTYVPDDNFEQALIDLGYDDILDDYVLTSNISGVTDLDISLKSISDLTGIEDFAALTDLDCHSNQLTSLDVSANMALDTLICYSCQLTSLDLSANTALTIIWCFGYQLSSLDLSANTDLQELRCGGNQLTSLDLSANTALTVLSCGNIPLTILDLSANTALEHLNCYNNQLTSLDLSANTALTYLNCHLNQLTSLDLSANTALTYLECPENSLTSLDLSANTALTYIWCSNNQLTSLDVSANTALTGLSCHTNQLTGLDISANMALTDLYCHTNQLTSLDVRNGNNANITDFDATNNPNLTCIYVDDKDAFYLSFWNIDPNSTFVETEAECDALTIIELHEDENFAVYPNPTTGTINLDLKNNSIYHIKIIDCTGKTVFKKTVTEQTNTVNISQLKSGVYIISIKSNKEIYTRKILKE